MNNIVATPLNSILAAGATMMALPMLYSSGASSGYLSSKQSAMLLVRDAAAAGLVGYHACLAFTGDISGYKGWAFAIAAGYLYHVSNLVGAMSTPPQYNIFAVLMK